MITSEVKNMAFGNSGIYQITVMGDLDISWSSRLSGMQISLDKRIDGKDVYSLVGKLKDQAELIGIINTLYDLHLSLIEVKTH
ncbi:hypothetical protein [Lutimonas vermicola]|uniref:STAS domain-containing protein n=1 Tax=Lutimonas vermicola TaxID=414288 RepID=A0ABU9L002_9FLAO